MQGNYHIKGSHIARANTLPIAALYAINSVAFFIYSALD
jgi:hypothetical protein